MSVRKSMAWSLTGSFGFFVVQFVASVIVARLLTPVEMGVYGVALAALTLLTAFQNLGFQSFIIRETDMDRATLGTVHSMAVLQALGLAVLLYAGAPLLADFLDEPRITHALRILSLYAIFVPVETLASGHLQKRGRFDLLTAMALSRVLVSAIASVALAYAGFSYASMPWGSVIGQVVATAAAFLLAGRDLAVRPTLSRWRAVWAYGSNILATMALANIFSRLPDIALGKLAGVAMVGLYGRASGIIESFNTGVMYGVQRVIMKAMVDSRDQIGRIDHVYLRAVRAATGLFWPMYAGLGVLATPVIVMVYGERWAAAAPVLALLCLAAIVQTGLVARQEVLIVTKHERVLPRLEGTRGVIGLGLFIAGASQGLAPAAASRIAEALAQHLLFVREIRGAIGSRFADIYRCYAGSAAVAAAAALPAALLMQWRGWPATLPVGEMLSAIGAGILLWLAMLFIVGHELRHEVVKLLGTVRRRFS
ncbi:oligosaccharide flippase family protein [Sphingoaurantiacus capsulatus]|uniref:Oligosaccharide flippase family protein n=1 Tax=Sphingoaurantiacus capsulatus TaxID=1771310 RepID=A0ABV7X9Z6_9SPHN